MTLRPLIVAFAVLATSLPVLAAEHVCSLTNNSGVDIIGMTVDGKSVPSFKRVGANSTRALTITLPDGVCEVRVRYTLSDGQDVDQGKYDACNGGGATIS